MYAFRFREQPDSVRPSQFQFGFAYTQNKQILFYLPFQVFLKNEQFNVFGELGYYRYIYRISGIGNETPEDKHEYYDAVYPRLRLNGVYQFRPKWYAGLRYWFDDYKIPKIDSAGILAQNQITGNKGGVISGAGPLLTFDSRDQIFYPTKGSIIEFELFFDQKALGSDFNFSRFSVDARTYISNNKNGVLALNAWLVSMHGDPPFQQLAKIGGPKKMRGYFEGRYRDKHLFMLQGEYRFPLFWRLGATVFGGAGNVAPAFSGLFSNELHFTYGAGLRLLLAKEDHINLRIDFGGNGEGHLFSYLTVGEAF